MTLMPRKYIILYIYIYKGTRCVSGGPRGCSQMGLVGLK
jgi:hypothetical protein